MSLSSHSEAARLQRAPPKQLLGTSLVSPSRFQSSSTCHPTLLDRVLRGRSRAEKVRTLRLSIYRYVCCSTVGRSPAELQNFGNSFEDRSNMACLGNAFTKECGVGASPKSCFCWDSTLGRNKHEKQLRILWRRGFKQTVANVN